MMDIDEMQAGRELDTLVAISAMGFADKRNAMGSDLAYFYMSIPHYSTDIAAAWQVVEKIKADHRVCLMLEDFQFDGKYWEACFKGRFDEENLKWTRLVYAFADAPELAICRAALKVIME
jgi:hypothetical protein